MNFQFYYLVAQVRLSFCQILSESKQVPNSLMTSPKNNSIKNTGIENGHKLIAWYIWSTRHKFGIYSFRLMSIKANIKGQCWITNLQQSQFEEIIKKQFGRRLGEHFPIRRVCLIKSFFEETMAEYFYSLIIKSFAVNSQMKS